MRRYRDGVAVLAIIAVVLVIAFAGAAGYFVFTRQKDKTEDTASTAVALSSAELAEIKTECNKEYNDEELCKYLSNLAGFETYQSTSTSKTTDGTTYVYVVEIDGDTSHFKSSTNGAENYESITIGKTTYTKDLKDGAWWKQVSDDSTVSSSVVEEITPEKEDFSDTTSTAPKTTYTRISKEACGERQCYKYQIGTAGETSYQQFVWFDDEAFLARRMLTIDSDGTTSDSTISYTKISITEPSPVKEGTPDYTSGFSTGSSGATEPSSQPDDGASSIDPAEPTETPTE